MCMLGQSWFQFHRRVGEVRGDEPVVAHSPLTKKTVCDAPVVQVLVDVGG